MPNCEHTFWLELAEGKAAPELLYGSRFARLVAELPKQSIQLPQVVFFMGKRLKNQALHQLCSSNYRGQSNSQGWVNIRSDNRTLHSLQPRFFADCDPIRRLLLPPFEIPRVCHREQVFPVELPPTEFSLQDIILSRLLFLFVDVLCIFADDVGGLSGVRELLSTWIRIGSASSLPRAIRPRVIIVVGHSQSITHSLLDEEDFLLGLYDNLPFYTVFSDIQFSRLPAGDLSPDARYTALGSDISLQLRNMRLYRDHHSAHFSATHLNAFFELAINHLSAAPFSPFDFVRCARQKNPLDGAFTSHLVNFLEVGNKSRASYDEIASYIASAILMDAYPPRMHYFCPSTVFDALYHDPCYSALRNYYSTNELASVQCTRIKKHLGTFFENMTANSIPSSRIHRDHLQRQMKSWTWLRSNKTCLWCLRHHPEHSQPCGHAICDTCTEIFGEASPHTDYEYTIRQCILCGSNGLTVRLNPPTAAPRVLSIDGGGPRGIVPIENLEMLQEVIGPDLPIVDLFELKVGTSSGGLQVLSMDILRLTPSECKALFHELAKEILDPARRKRFFSFMFSDQVYDTQALEGFLKNHFEPTRRLFDAPRSLISAGKVAVTATSIKDGAPFLFTNYNGAAPHRAEPVYGRLRPNVEDEPFVWQVARATSAAPPLFSTIDIPGLGTFQDGGMGRHNNPVNLALSEARHLWPNVADPDVVITLGTGSEVTSPKASRFRNVLVDGWIPRVYRSMKTSFDGKTTWKELDMRLGNSSDGDYFRFDTFHPSGLPAMNNTDCMDDLCGMVRMQDGENHEAAASALLAACLFFQLDDVPEYRSGLFHCIGTIRCRAPPQPLIRRLGQIAGSPDFYKDKINLGVHLSSDDICHECHRYSLPIRFFVRDLEERISLSIRLDSTMRRLSAFPNSIKWFIDEQKLDCPFGSLNHGIPTRVECPACDIGGKARGKKRKYMDI